MRLRSVEGDLGPEDVGLELSDRSLTAWRRLGAPADLYDVDLAAERAAAARMAPIDPGRAGLPDEVYNPLELRRLLAFRYWAWARPAFLAGAKALTAEERARLARRPKLHARPDAEQGDGLTDQPPNRRNLQ